MKVLYSVKSLINRVIDFFIGFRSDRWFLLFGLIFSVYIFAFLFYLTCSQVVSFFNSANADLQFDNDDYGFIHDVSLMENAIHSIAFFTLALLGKWIIDKLRNTAATSFTGYISKIKSSTWLLYFTLAILVQILNYIPISYDYMLNSPYLFGFGYNNYWMGVLFECIRILLPIITVFGAYSLTNTNLSIIKTLKNKNQILIAILIVAFILTSTQETFFWFINHTFTAIFGFLFESPVVSLLVYGVIGLILLSPFILAKLILILDENDDSKDKFRIEKKIKNDDILEVN